MTIVPQIEGLTIPEILEFGRSNWDILDYLPEHKDCRLPSREFLWNVLNTLIRNKFQAFIKFKLAKREKKMIDKRNLGVKILPEFIKIFKESKNISCKSCQCFYILQMKKVEAIISAERKDWQSKKEN